MLDDQPLGEYPELDPMPSVEEYEQMKLRRDQFLCSRRPIWF